MIKSTIMCSILLLLMTACPYSSSVPLDNPKVSVSDKLLGKWIEESDFNDNPDYYIFKKKDDTRYVLEEYAFDSELESYTQNDEYIGHITLLGDVEFFNLFKDDEATYYFYKLEFPSNSQLIMHEVTDNITEEFTSSAELKTFFEKNKHLSFFYNRDPKKYKR
jgi:hypothetical protein